MTKGRCLRSAKAMDGGVANSASELWDLTLSLLVDPSPWRGRAQRRLVPRS